MLDRIEFSRRDFTKAREDQVERLAVRHDCLDELPEITAIDALAPPGPQRIAGACPAKTAD
jgi:hypothetical protein